MKSKDLLLSFMALAFFGVSVILINQGTKEQKKVHPKKVESEEGIEGAIEWLQQIRANQVTGIVSDADVLMARKQIAQMQNNKSLNIPWNELGPSNVGGRTRAILIDKNDHNLLFAGGVSGGLWKSNTGGTSWSQVTSFPDMKICCIAQNQSNGAMYVGTGESFANPDGTTYGTPGFIGSGLYESTDGGTTWHIFNNATPSTLNITTTEWAFVNKIAVDPSNGRVFAATNKGLRYWDGSAWINPLWLSGTIQNQGNCNTVAVAPGGIVITVVGNKVFRSTSNGDNHTFIGIPALIAGASRTEIAIAPGNPAYVYASVAAGDGTLKGVFRSTDTCSSCTLIGPGGAPAFNLFGSGGSNQGGYDNVIAVYPNNPDKILVGGVNVWQWVNGSNFTQITYGQDSHVDIHAIVFDKTNPNVIYIGSDGGISKTSDGVTFHPINKNYDVTQLYAVAFNQKGAVMGGTQDNSCPYINRRGLDPKVCRILYGGDGGWSAFSIIDTSVFFGSSQYGGVWRSPDHGLPNTYNEAAASQFFSPIMIGTATPGTTTNYAPFVTPMFHWEGLYNIYSPDSVYFKATIHYHAGTTVLARSHNAGYPFPVVLADSMNAGDSIKVQDVVSSRFYVALSSGIWMTRSALDFSITPKWYKVCDKAVQNLTVSNDGNYLFAGTGSGQVIRISNLLAVRDSLTGYISSPYCVLEQKIIKTFSSRYVTSIAIDPNNPARIIVTLGNYGNTDYIEYCENALDAAPVFTSKQGTTPGQALPAMPLYSGLIEVTNHNRVLVGTEYGIFATDDITANAADIVWTQENTGMNAVPVFMIRQQSQLLPPIPKVTCNFGVVYIGTHGRGFFESTMWQDTTGIEQHTMPLVAKPSLNIYPNPVMDQVHVNFTLPVAAQVSINIFDISGRLLRTVDLSRQTVGKHTTAIDCNMFSRGSYILQLVAGKDHSTAKFVITK